MSDMTDADCLRAAVDEIECRGWFQGYWGEHDDFGEYPPDCKLCGWGAVSMVVCGTPTPQTDGSFSQYRRITEALDKASGGHFPTWQDMPGRTWAEVQSLMLEVAAKLEGSR